MPLYIAVIILAMAAALTACDNFNQSLKPEIEYNGSVEPAHDAAGLQAAINAIPPGGSGTVTVMRSFTLGAPVEIGGNRAVTLEAYSGTITVAVLTRGAGFDGSFFDVQSGASLSLRGDREKGTLVLDGASTSGYATALVTVSGGALTLGDRATLRNNTGVYRGGVYVENGGSFTMTGGEISGNTVTGSGQGAGVSVYNGSFTMTGGKITGNASMQYDGGGVAVNGDNGSFTMRGGTITGNSAAYGGGGVSFSGNSFIMSGGTIAHNTATGYGGGGGVYFSGDTFTMTGGTITYNTVTSDGSGGGVRGGGGGGFTMTGGTIAYNTVTGTGEGGGGVYVEGGSFTMTGGTIAGNTGTGCGGGVYAAWGSFSKSGGGIIYGDTDATHTLGSNENPAAGGPANGHAVYYSGGSGKYYRNATLGADEGISTDTLPGDMTNWIKK
ncbi:MAG: right-handed parallel beta-helix repeat-containing protein [Treponema sp.]|nr:right-handed parallel beta-helix repeat-containing protein [Treponema sp.]